MSSGWARQRLRQQSEYKVGGGAEEGGRFRPCPLAIQEVERGPRQVNLKVVAPFERFDSAQLSSMLVPDPTLLFMW